MTGTETLFVGPQLELVANRNLSVAVWRDVPTVEVMREVSRAGRTLSKRYPTGTGHMNLFVGGTPRFTEEVRAETVKIARDSTLFTLGVARVFLVGGFVGVAVRTFLNTATLVAGGSSRPVQAFTNVEDAAAWLAPKLEVGETHWKPADIVTLAAPFVKSV